MKLLISFCVVGSLTAFRMARAQRAISNDSIYHDLKVCESPLSKVIEQLGPPSYQKETMGTRNSKYSNGTCVTSQFVYGYALFYRKTHVVVYVNKRHDWVEEIHFGTSSSFISVKGNQAQKSSFADVLAEYGGIDFDKRNNDFPKLQQESTSGKWVTKLMYPGISFVSFGKRQPLENLIIRKVDEIWLE